ncbi:unnamed protein product, partial [Vitis vinifera]
MLLPNSFLLLQHAFPYFQTSISSHLNVGHLNLHPPCHMNLLLQDHCLIHQLWKRNLPIANCLQENQSYCTQLNP